MKLKNKDQASFELNIQNYQYPGLKTEGYDSNWLMVQIKVNHPKGKWESVDPSLLTWELKEIAEWFEKIQKKEIVEKELVFIEPNLSFKLMGESKYIRIYFDLEYRPTWAASKIAGGEDLWLDIEIENNNLTAAAEDLRRQLSMFPQRADK